MAARAKAVTVFALCALPLLPARQAGAQADAPGATEPAAPVQRPAAPAAPPPVSQGALAPEGKFDLEGARRQVRAMKFDDEMPEPSGRAFSAAPSREDQKFRQKFSQAKRPWCLTAYQGAGILAPLAMLITTITDKKDHGCKW